VAKKSRTPPPPRKVQAPRPVQAPRERRDPRRHGPLGAPPLGQFARNRIALILGLIVVAVVVAVVLAVTAGGSPTLTAGGCIFNTYASQGRQHITASNPVPKGFHYNSFPPTSGWHLPQPQAPAIWNIYDQPIRQVVLIHNLEHGGVVVQYGSQVPQATVAKIAEWYRSDPDGIVVAPLPALEDRVVLTAWTHELSCPGFSEKAFDGFKDRFRGKGPERFPTEALKPGTQ
jgi:hypothetical protein